MSPNVSGCGLEAPDLLAGREAAYFALADLLVDTFEDTFEDMVAQLELDG